MSVLGVDSVIKSLASYFNLGVNLMTKQFYSRLDPKLGEVD